MQETGEILKNLGYEEASKKPNLFYKKIYKENGNYEILFADLRGRLYDPIWKNLRVSLYPDFDWVFSNKTSSHPSINICYLL